MPSSNEVSSPAISFINSNRVRSKADLILGNRKKLHDVKSGEYNACSNTGVPLAAK